MTPPIDLLHHPAVAWTIFGLVYLGMAVGRVPGLVIDRAGIALLGAAAMLATGLIDLPAAWRSIDAETVLLLFGLMLFSTQLRAAGFYDAVARSVTRLAASGPDRLMIVLILASAGLSAVLVNDIVCLAFTPPLCIALVRAGRDPVPYLIALACASNIGSAATLIGNPQNMYIGAVSGVRFGHFLLVMLPATAVGLALLYGVLRAVMGRRLTTRREPQAAPPVDVTPVDRAAVAKTLVVLAGVVACLFLFHGPGRAIAAVAGGLLLLISRRPSARGLIERVDWNLVLLFVGLFVVNGAMRGRGLTAELFDAIRATGVDLHATWPLSVTTLALSNVVSNVPAVLLLSPTVEAAGADRLWYLLALASTWAGNLTLVGSIANLIVAEQAAAMGVRLGFRDHIAVGLPVTLVTVAFGTLYIAMVM